MAAIASVPFGILVDKVKRTRLLGLSIILWGVSMVWSATVGSFGKLLLARLFLGVVTAVAGPVVASLVGDYFVSSERGRIYGWILTGELLGAGVGFAVTGDIAALSWRAAFVILAIPTFVLARFALKLPEPVRGAARPLLRENTPGAQSPTAEPEQTGEEEATASRETDAQRLARERGVDYDHELVDGHEVERLGFTGAIRYILHIRTNVILIIASACGYFYLSGVQTFGVEFAKDQFRVNQALANALLLVIGGGAVIGVLAAGYLSDLVLRRGQLNARVLITGVAALATVALFIPALTTRSAVTALPYLILAAFFLSAQNPPIDAARLDIMPALLWGRAEGVRTALRTGAQALAPVLFGAMADHLFGGGRSGLQLTFIIMLLPLTANGVILLRGMRTYPRDVATAAASTQRMLQRTGAQEGGPPAAGSPAAASSSPVAGGAAQRNTANGGVAARPGDGPGGGAGSQSGGRHFQTGGGTSPTGAGTPAAEWADPPTEIGRATDSSTAEASEATKAGTEPFTDRWAEETSQWPDPQRLPPANWTEPDR